MRKRMNNRLFAAILILAMAILSIQPVWAEEGAKGEVILPEEAEDFQILFEEPEEEFRVETADEGDPADAGDPAEGPETGSGEEGSVPEKIAITSVTLPSASKKYTGTERTMTSGIVVTAEVDGESKVLTNWKDYRVTYKNNINVGTASAIVEGKGNYTGKITKKFKITAVKLKSASLKYTYKVYTGTARTMDGTTTVKAEVNGKVKTLKKGTDYTISYKNNIKAGIATMTIKGRGNYTGTLTKTFKIYPDISVEKTRIFRRNNHIWYAKITASGPDTVWTKNTNQDKGMSRDTVGGLCFDSFGRYFYYDNGTLVALDVLTGKEIWHYSNSSDIECGVHACVDDSGNVFVVSGQAGNPVAYLNKNGKLVKRISWRKNGTYTLPSGIRYKGGKILLDVKTQTGMTVTLKINPSTGKVS